MNLTAEPEPAAPNRAGLVKFAWLSVAAALVTIVLKVSAWWLTGSVGLLSDAAESGVNLAAAILAVYVLTVAARPADDDHHFGHTKAEYFSAAVEGALILVAAVLISIGAVQRLLDPQPLDQVGWGLGLSTLAAVVNGAVAWVLIQAGRRHSSVTLTADGKHLLTDLWTSCGVLAGIALVWMTGWWILDPIVAIGVAINILFTGAKLLIEAVDGLMDKAPDEEVLVGLESSIRDVCGRHVGVDFHRLRVRQAGATTFVSVHVTVPGDWSVDRAHDLTDELEAHLDSFMDHVDSDVHIEPAQADGACPTHRWRSRARTPHEVAE